MRYKSAIVSIVALLLSQQGAALDVKLDGLRDSIETLHDGQVVKVERIQDIEHTITGSFSKTSRKCPPFCIQPTQVNPSVRTVTEIDIFDFMEKDIIAGTGVLVDARIESWNRKGTIPGSINIPFTIFEALPSDKILVDALYKLGVRQRGEVGAFTRMLEGFGFMNGHLKTNDWDFSQSKSLVLWCNGPWCGQSPRAIRALLKLGYPADRLNYYRGGMQVWQSLGLTTINP